MFCTTCGKELHNDAVICPACGVPTQNFKDNKIVSDDSAGCLLGGACFWLPLLGLVLYLVWKDTKPKSAKFAGTWGLIGFIVNLIIGILYVVFFFIIGETGYLIY